VQLHHIDRDPSNNIAENLASLCLVHHDMATMQIGLTKKLQPDQVRIYKVRWEKKCSDDVQALARKRFAFYYCMYKNPPRLLEAYRSLSREERTTAVGRLRAHLRKEQEVEERDPIFSPGSVPAIDRSTELALRSVELGEPYPSYLGKFSPHEADPNYSRDCSTQEAMGAYHLYDLWCQVICQALAEARGSIPIEDIFKFSDQDDFDYLAGRLVNFKLTIYGKGIHLPGYWKKFPVGSLQSRQKIQKRLYRVRMQIRTMYLFSDTAAISLARGRVSGIGILNGVIVEEDPNEFEIAIVPLLIGSGGPNLWNN
jgi:hypothetical protein